MFSIAFISAGKPITTCYESDGITSCKKEMVNFWRGSDLNNGGNVNSHWKLIAKWWVYDENGKLINELSTVDLDNANFHTNYDKGNYVRSDFWGFLKYEKCWVKKVIIKGNEKINHYECRIDE